MMTLHALIEIRISDWLTLWRDVSEMFAHVGSFNQKCANGLLICQPGSNGPHGGVAAKYPKMDCQC